MFLGIWIQYFLSTSEIMWLQRFSFRKQSNSLQMLLLLRVVFSMAPDFL